MTFSKRHFWQVFPLFVLLALIAIVYLFPAFMTVLYSFKDRKDMFLTGPLEFPNHLYFGNYEQSIKRVRFFRTLFNSVVITGAAVFLSVMLSAVTGYAVARGSGKRFTVIYYLFIAGLLIPYHAVFVPIYLIGSKLGFVNNFAGVIILYTAAQLPFGVFLMTGFMKNVPLSIEEASIIDGCNTVQTFWYVVLPLLRPALVALAVLRALLIWNDYLLAKLFLQRGELQTLTVSISNLFGQYRYDLNIAFAAIILASAPMLLFFVFNQRNLEGGITVGAVKG